MPRRNRQYKYDFTRKEFEVIVVLYEKVTQDPEQPYLWVGDITERVDRFFRRSDIPAKRATVHDCLARLVDRTLVEQKWEEFNPYLEERNRPARKLYAISELGAHAVGTVVREEIERSFLLTTILQSSLTEDVSQQIMNAALTGENVAESQ